MKQKFNMRDIVFLAILSAVLLLASSLVMPIVMFTQIFALRQLFAAPIFAIFVMIALKKVPKMGALSFIGLLTGGVLLFMSPIMFLNNFGGALVTELIVFLIFKTYESDKAKMTAAALYMPVTLPFTLLGNSLVKGLSLAEQLSSFLEIVIIPVASIALGIAGAIIGLKIANEMKKAGKL